MQYKVHNIKTLENKNDRNRAQKIIRKQILRLEHIEGNYPKPIRVNIYFNRSDRINYVVSCIIKMKEGVVFVKEKGQNTEAIIHGVFDRLKVALNKKINKERKEYLRKFKNKHSEVFNEYLSELQELRNSDTRPAFNELLKILLSDVAKYVKRRIKSAEMTTAIHRGKFKKQEILDEIYLHLYDHFNEIPDDEGYTKIWLYQIADQIMEEKFKEIEFEKEHIERLSEIVESEYASMDEEYTVDAEEEIIPIEELDEYESHSDLSMATILCQEDEDSLLDELTLKINRRDITRSIEKELTKLPVFERTIMEFFLINQMTINEISEIKRIPAPEIEQVIDRVGREIKQKLAHQLE
jgi:DNA-directed RNA polymerase specialized sigma24 family protein/ribosome-associated translation inhibitor RaiA